MKLKHIGLFALLFTLTFTPTFAQANESIHGSKTTINKARDLSFLTPPEAPVVEPVEVTYISYWVRQDLNIREKPSIEGERLGVIPEGEKITVTSLDVTDRMLEGWIPVKWNEIEGYVALRYLSDEEYVAVPSLDNVRPNHLYVMGKSFLYENGGKEFGQSIIDSDVGMISTWGGAPIWSGTDNFNTHFIAHSSGAFEGLWHVNPGERILVTDEHLNATEYVIRDKFIVDDYGYKDGENLFDYIAGRGEGEVITLQTCETEETNWIIRAEKME